MNSRHEQGTGKFAHKLGARIVFGLKKWLVRLAVVAAFGWTFYFGNVLHVFDTAREVYAENTSVPLSGFDIKGKTVDQLEAEVIHDLSVNENEGGLPAYLDDNSKGTLSKKDKLSYGCMSYKLSTVERHYKGINGVTLSDLDAALLALDCTKARALAQEAIFGKLNAIDEWMGATDKMKLKVAIIREML